MSDSVQSAIFEIPRKFHAELSKVQGDLANVLSRLENVKKRTASIDETVRKMRRNNAGLLIMARMTVGHFAERISHLESKMERVIADER